MKEFLKSNTITYNLMSFTGFKSLILFSLLLESPKTYEDICEYFRNHEYIKEEISMDTLRVYITSLKRIGCEITRTKSPRGGLYSIVSHPFEFRVSEEQIKALLKIYRIISANVNIEDLLKYDKFLKKLSDNINSANLSDAVKNISAFKNIDLYLLENLIKYSKEKRTLTLSYNSPKNGIKEIKVIPDKVEISQSKIYLYGISLDYNQETSYLVQRIEKIIDVDLENKNEVELNKTTVGYELMSLNPDVKLGNNDKIVEIKDDSVIVETQTTNLFMLKRRLLGYGPMCTVLYPEDFRNDIIKTLKNMREGYKDE